MTTESTFTVADPGAEHEFVFVVETTGKGAVVWRCDVGDPAGDHLYHLDLTNHPVGTEHRYRLDAVARTITRDLGNPEDTFTGDVALRSVGPSGRCGGPEITTQSVDESRPVWLYRVMTISNEVQQPSGIEVEELLGEQFGPEHYGQFYLIWYSRTRVASDEDLIAWARSTVPQEWHSWISEIRVARRTEADPR